MAFMGQQGPRQMFDVSSMGLKCSQCGAEIKQLPFQPSSGRPVYCKECNAARKRMDNRF